MFGCPVAEAARGEYLTELSQKTTLSTPEMLTFFPEIIPFSPEEMFFENIRVEKSRSVTLSVAEIKA